MDDNPYRAPEFAPSRPIWEDGFGSEASALTEAEIRAFVGRNADYYLKKWTPALRAQEWAGFNGAALLLSGLWLPYRKMYHVSLILYFIIASEAIIEEVALVGGLASPDALGFFGRIVGLVASIACGMFGNSWYLSHAKKVIMDVRLRGLEGDAHLEDLSRRGGTSLAASFGMFFLFLVGISLIGIAVELALPDG